jgi:hypothetical protein
MKVTINITESQYQKLLNKNLLIEELQLKTTKEIQNFQDWMDKNHPNWVKDVDGKWKNLRKGSRTVGGRGYGKLGPSTKNALKLFGNEYSKGGGGGKKVVGTGFPYSDLRKNPSPDFIAQVIKKSNGGPFGDDKEAWAEAAFNTIGSKSTYNLVSKKLGQDAYSYLESFIDTKEKYHVNPIFTHYTELFPEFAPTSCSPDVIKPSNWSGLYKTLVGRKMISDGEPLLIIWGPSQTLYYTTDGKSSKLTTKVSTGKGGFGNTPDQPKTSTGLLEVAGKIRAKDYEVLVYKSPTGTILGPNKESSRVDDEGTHHIAEVLTGILELDGLEPCNENTFSRNIYIHGTNRESLLGNKRSNGCIRVPNNVIKQLLSSISEGTKVYVYPG